MNPEERRIQRLVIARRRRQVRQGRGPYGADDDINVVSVNVELGGAFCGPMTAAEHRADAMRERSRR